MAEQQPQGPVADLSFADIAVRDPLTPVTRQQRLYLLAVSMIAIAIVYTGLVPSKIATFGIELNEPDRSALLFLLALITIYFLASFAIYGASDYATRRQVLREAVEQRQRKLRYQEVAIRLKTSEEAVARWYQEGDFEARVREKMSDEQSVQDTLQVLENPEVTYDMVRQAIESNRSESEYQWRTLLTARARTAFEFFVPPIVGFYAIYTLLRRTFAVPDIPEIVASIAIFGLIGLIAGILGRWVMPADDPGGYIITVLLGEVGAFSGGLVSSAFFGGPGVTGVNLISIVVAIVGAVTLLGIYYLLTRRVVI